MRLPCIINLVSNMLLAGVLLSASSVSNAVVLVPSKWLVPPLSNKLVRCPRIVTGRLLPTVISISTVVALLLILKVPVVWSIVTVSCRPFLVSLSS